MCEVRTLAVMTNTPNLTDKMPHEASEGSQVGDRFTNLSSVPGVTQTTWESNKYQ